MVSNSTGTPRNGVQRGTNSGHAGSHRDSVPVLDVSNNSKSFRTGWVLERSRQTEIPSTIPYLPGVASPLATQRSVITIGVGCDILYRAVSQWLRRQWSASRVASTARLRRRRLNAVYEYSASACVHTLPRFFRDLWGCKRSGSIPFCKILPDSGNHMHASSLLRAHALYRARCLQANILEVQERK